MWRGGWLFVRHRVYGSLLGRNKDERDRLFKSLISSLFLHSTIETSDKKAKAIKGLIDKIINLAKNKNTQRLLSSYLNNKELQERLIKEIVPKLGNRTSGYTSVVRLGRRLGDQTMMVKMSLIGVEEMKPVKEESRVKEKTETPVKKETKIKQKAKKVVKKSVRTANKKVSTSRKGAKKS